MDKSLLILSLSLLATVVNAEDAQAPVEPKKEALQPQKPRVQAKRELHEGAKKPASQSTAASPALPKAEDVKKDVTAKILQEKASQEAKSAPKVAETTPAQKMNESKEAKLAPSAEKGKEDAKSAPAMAAPSVKKEDTSKLGQAESKQEAKTNASAPSLKKEEPIKLGQTQDTAKDDPKTTPLADSPSKKTNLDLNRTSVQNEQPGQDLNNTPQPSAPGSQEVRIRQLENQVSDMQSKMQRKRDPFSVQPQTYTGLYATGEWLYWQFTEAGTEYAVTQEFNSPEEIAEGAGDLDDGRSRHVSFDWESGFRVGLGYHFKERGWDLYVSYTQIEPSGNDSVSGTIDPILMYQGDFVTEFASSASANWNIEFKVLDFEIGRRYYIAKSLYMKPHFGLKAALIEQHAHVRYGNTNPVFYSSTSPFTFPSGIPLGKSFSVQETNDFRGIGLRAGVDSLWNMGWGLSLFGKISGALLVSEMETHQKQYQIRTDAMTGVLTNVENIDLKSEYHPVLPTVQLAFGLCWDWGFCDDKLRVGLDAGFESQYWWRQNQMERFFDYALPPPNYVRVSEDLGMYGLTLGGRIDF